MKCGRGTFRVWHVKSITVYSWTSMVDLGLSQLCEKQNKTKQSKKEMVLLF